jgi:zinc transport system substrate-binding protein
VKAGLILTSLVLVALPLGACADDGPARRDGGPVTVAAAFYPLAEAARQVGGDAVRVTDLTPAGAEPHDLELSSKKVDALEDADVVLIMGRRFQPAVEDVAARRSSGTVTILDDLEATKTVKGEVADEDEASSAALDPHVWLDPVQMAEIVAVVADALEEVAPEHRAAFAANAQRYRDELSKLDDELRAGLDTCERTDIVTAHAAFGWLAKRYHLHQEGIVGIVADQEPDARRLAALADLVAAKRITTIFTETLVSPAIAKALADEAGVRTAVLDPLEGLTKRNAAAGADYLSVMRSNLAILRTALGCG